jgi:hypothetical protein
MPSGHADQFLELLRSLSCSERLLPIASWSDLATMATASKVMSCPGNSNRHRELRRRAWKAMA